MRFCRHSIQKIAMFGREKANLLKTEDGQRLADDYMAVFGNCLPATDAVLSDLAAYCNLGRPSFVPGDPQATAYNEGLRAALLHILSMSSLKPEDFLVR